MKKARQLIMGLFLSGVVWAASEYSDYLAALSARESGSNPGTVNKYGFLGSYQMGERAFIDAGYYLKDHTPDTNDWKGTWTGKNGIYFARSHFRLSDALFCPVAALRKQLHSLLCACFRALLPNKIALS